MVMMSSKQNCSYIIFIIIFGKALWSTYTLSIDKLVISL